MFEPHIRPLRPCIGKIVMMNGSAYFSTVKNGKLTVFRASLDEINKAFERNDLKEHPLEKIIPKHYCEFLPQFCMVLDDSVPPHRPGIDHEVRLKDAETQRWGLV